MVCNLVTYRARSAVREVGYALGFPRPLVDRVAKALETYDSVMVRRDLEADGGFAEFFRRTGEGEPAEALAAAEAEAHGLVDGMGQLNTRIPLVGKVPPWRQPPKPEDPDAPRPFGWLREPRGGRGAAGVESARGRRAGRRDSATIRWRRGRRSGAVARPGTRAGRATRRRAWRGCGPVGGRAMPERERLVPPALVGGRPSIRRAARSSRRRVPTDRLGRPNRWDPPPRPPRSGGARAGAGTGASDHSSVARIEPEERPTARGGSTVGLSHWERWLEFCARIDGFPRHLSIHSGGMLVTAAPLIDIAPLERATCRIGSSSSSTSATSRRSSSSSSTCSASGCWPRWTRRSSSSSTTARSASISIDCRRTCRRSSRCSRRPTRSGSSRSRAGRRCRRCRSRGRRTSTTSWSRSRSSGRARSRATPSTRSCGASRASSP